MAFDPALGPDQLITSNELQALLNVTKPWVRRWIEEGAIPYYAIQVPRVGKTNRTKSVIRFRYSEILEIMRRVNEGRDSLEPDGEVSFINAARFLDIGVLAIKMARRRGSLKNLKPETLRRYLIHSRMRKLRTNRQSTLIILRKHFMRPKICRRCEGLENLRVESGDLIVADLPVSQAWSEAPPLEQLRRVLRLSSQESIHTPLQT